MPKLDMTGWNDKDSSKPECRKLYEELGYIEAYGRHTDIRCLRENGPKGAIGRADEWDSHGALQLEFLQEKGLRPTSRFLDFGCGAGRLARQVVPYLSEGEYIGMDISDGVLRHAAVTANEEGWICYGPTFLKGDGTLSLVQDEAFDLIWAHSVFTHLPPEYIERILAQLAGMDFGAFFFTYKRLEPGAKGTNRSGLKQFQYTEAWMLEAIARAGLRGEAIDVRWPAGQWTMGVTL